MSERAPSSGELRRLIVESVASGYGFDVRRGVLEIANAGPRRLELEARFYAAGVELVAAIGDPHPDDEPAGLARALYTAIVAEGSAEDLQAFREFVAARILELAADEGGPRGKA